jgi:aspartyl-tRNA(Asn)/glutamyl-tRNA(Gln) amidotransferase subunit C
MITKETVGYIAGLARLKLSAQEQESMAAQMDAVMAYIDQLKAVDTTGIEPTCFVVPDHDPLRDDVVRPSLAPEELLKNGPAVQGRFFAVPKVIS